MKNEKQNVYQYPPPMATSIAERGTSVNTLGSGLGDDAPKAISKCSINHFHTNINHRIFGFIVTSERLDLFRFDVVRWLLFVYPDKS